MRSACHSNSDIYPCSTIAFIFCCLVMSFDWEPLHVFPLGPDCPSFSQWPGDRAPLLSSVWRPLSRPSSLTFLVALFSPALFLPGKLHILLVPVNNGSSYFFSIQLSWLQNPKDTEHALSLKFHLKRHLTPSLGYSQLMFSECQEKECGSRMTKSCNLSIMCGGVWCIVWE